MTPSERFMSHSYPSDITREQFDIIRPILKSARKSTRPRTKVLNVLVSLKCEQQRKQDEWDMLDTHDEKKEKELPHSDLK